MIDWSVSRHDNNCDELTQLWRDWLAWSVVVINIASLLGCSFDQFTFASILLSPDLSITPMGGVGFIAGWLLLLLEVKNGGASSKI
jgi:uncharacterized membrane protein YgdD (TMEM256/DUF423 family)